MVANTPKTVSPADGGSGTGTEKSTVSSGANSGTPCSIAPALVKNARNVVGTFSLSFFNSQPKFGKVPSSQPCTSDTICAVDPQT